LWQERRERLAGGGRRPRRASLAPAQLWLMLARGPHGFVQRDDLRRRKQSERRSSWRASSMGLVAAGRSPASSCTFAITFRSEARSACCSAGLPRTRKLRTARREARSAPPTSFPPA